MPTRHAHSHVIPFVAMLFAAAPVIAEEAPKTPAVASTTPVPSAEPCRTMPDGSVTCRFVFRCAAPLVLSGLQSACKSVEGAQECEVQAECTVSGDKEAARGLIDQVGPPEPRAGDTAPPAGTYMMVPGAFSQPGIIFLPGAPSVAAPAMPDPNRGISGLTRDR